MSSNLKQVIADALRQTPVSFEPFKQHLESIKTKEAGKAIDNARVGNIPLSDWLKQRMEQEENRPDDEKFGDEIVLRIMELVLERRQKSIVNETRRKAKQNG